MKTNKLTSVNKSTLEKGFFAYSALDKQRQFYDYKLLEEFIGHIKGLGLKVVLASGTFDMLHIGHARYFEVAKKPFLVAKLYWQTPCQ